MPPERTGEPQEENVPWHVANEHRHLRRRLAVGERDILLR
jgi:hypothetical protein